MKKYIFAAWMMGWLGCGGESLPPASNPLETYDQARLGVLIHAAVNRGKAAECARYFQETDKPAPDDPEAMVRAVLAQTCPESMVKIAAYLEHNGVAGVTADHVKDVAFWERMKAGVEVERARLQQEREQEQAARAAARQAKAEAARVCRQQVDSAEQERLKKRSMPLRKDFPDLEAWTAAWNEAGRRDAEGAQKYRAERAACDAEGDEGSGAGRIKFDLGGAGGLGPAGRADLGISLPEGMRVNAFGRIN